MGRNLRAWALGVGCLVACGVVACTPAADDDDSTGTGGTLASGSGGMVVVGTGGMTSMAGSGGMTGTGGMTGAGGSGGMTGGGGSGGAMGDAGMMMGSGCEECEAMMCAAEVAALMGDVDGTAVVTCVKAHPCKDSCCVCDVMCGSLGEGYGNGPCSQELEKAAGTTVDGGAVTSGTEVMTKCAATATDGNSCAKAIKLGDCSTMMCADKCTPRPACM